MGRLWYNGAKAMGMRGGRRVITREEVDGLTLLQSSEEFRLTRDALALARFATLHRGDRVCDLGCGVAICSSPWPPGRTG